MKNEIYTEVYITSNIDETLRGIVAHKFECDSCGNSGYIIGTNKMPLALICITCYDENNTQNKLKLTSFSMFKKEENNGKI